MTEIATAEVVPADVLAALGRLNHHARAQRRFFGTEWRAIYAYKLVAALALAEARRLTLRFIEWRGKCNRCDGTGQFWNYDPNYKTPCRNCGAKGIALLRFVETTLPDGQVWHHPWRHGEPIAETVLGRIEWVGDGNWVVNDPEYVGGKRSLRWEQATDWGPNLPAERIPDAELIPLLNLVEDWIARPIDVGVCGPWRLERARREMSQYMLDLGRAGGGCCFCGSTEQGEHPRSIGLSLDRLKWSLPVCPQHDRVPSEKWPERIVPADLLTSDLQRWLSNPARREPRRKEEEHW